MEKENMEWVKGSGVDYGTEEGSGYSINQGGKVGFCENRRFERRLKGSEGIIPVDPKRGGFQVGERIRAKTLRQLYAW